jgi:hypothetical protein
LRFAVYFVVMVVIALSLGFGLTYFALVEGGIYGTFHRGVWQARPEVGSSTPDPYTRAFLARAEALQLGRGEGIQFFAAHDEDGHKLNLSCNYTLSGQTPVAAFWTLRATDIRGTNVASEHAPASINSRSIVRTDEGQILLHMGKTLAPGNWLELAGDGDFQLILTFYDASFFAGLGSSITVLPSLVREDCA